MYCYIRTLQRFDRIRGRYRHGFHPTAMRSFNSDQSIFEDHAAPWIQPDSFRGRQKHLGIGLSVRNVLGSNDRREEISEPDHVQDRLDDRGDKGENRVHVQRNARGSVQRDRRTDDIEETLRDQGRLKELKENHII